MKHPGGTSGSVLTYWGVCLYAILSSKQQMHMKNKLQKLYRLCGLFSSAESTRGSSGAHRSYARELFSGEEIFNRGKGAPRERRPSVSARTERSWHGRQCLALWELLLFLSWLQPEVSRKLEPTFTAVQRGVHAASRGPRLPGAMPWLKLTSHKFA